MKPKNYVPYTYLIGWRKLDVWYYGARYRKDCNPSDLWNPYRTSSNYVANCINDFGDPDVIRVHKTFTTKEECLRYEAKFQKRVSAVRSNRWLNRHTNGSRWFSYPRVGYSWWNNGIVESKLKVCPAGWVKGRLFRHSSVHMSKLAAGKVWWNNGKEQTRTNECPEGWIAGRIPDTDISRENKRKMRLGKTHSAETRQKMKEAWVRRKIHPMKKVGGVS